MTDEAPGAGEVDAMTPAEQMHQIATNAADPDVVNAMVVWTMEQVMARAQTGRFSSSCWRKDVARAGRGHGSVKDSEWALVLAELKNKGFAVDLSDEILWVQW